jgi:transposase
LPPYSPDLNPTEGAFAKVKGLLRRSGERTRETLIEAMGRASDAVTARDARGFFEHCGYRLRPNPYANCFGPNLTARCFRLLFRQALPGR